jgi:hypothetical protein
MFAVLHQAIRPALLLAVAAAACTSSSEPVVENDRVATIAVGDGTAGLEERARAVESFRGQRSAVRLDLAFTTIEGDSIFYTLTVSQGSATLVIDETRDGGGVRTLSLTSLELVRYIPSVWVNNVEVAKERLEPVEPADARATDGRYLLRGRTCAGSDPGCVVTF